MVTTYNNHDGKGVKYGPWFYGFRHLLTIRAHPVYEGGYCTQTTVCVHSPTLRGGEEREGQKCAGQGKRRPEEERRQGQGYPTHRQSLSLLLLIHFVSACVGVHKCAHTHTPNLQACPVSVSQFQYLCFSIKNSHLKHFFGGGNKVGSQRFSSNSECITYNLKTKYICLIKYNNLLHNYFLLSDLIPTHICLSFLSKGETNMTTNTLELGRGRELGAFLV